MGRFDNLSELPPVAQEQRRLGVVWALLGQAYAQSGLQLWFIELYTTVGQGRARQGRTATAATLYLYIDS